MQIIKGIEFVLLFTILGQILSFFQEILIAAKFGTTYFTDAFFLAFTIPFIIGQELFGGIINPTFTPIFTEYKLHHGESEAQKASSAVVNIFVLLTTFICLLGIFLAPKIVKFIAPGFDLVTYELATKLTKILFLIVIFIPLLGIFGNLLNIYRKFILPPLNKPILISSTILSILFFSKEMGVYSIAYGLIVGCVIFFFLEIYVLTKQKIPLFNFIFYHPACKKMLKLSLPLFLFSGINQISLIIQRMLASGLGEGTIAVLNFAFKLTNLPVVSLTMGIIPMIFPTISEYAQTDKTKLKEILIYGLRFIFFLLLPLTIIMILFRVPIVKLIFERGQFNHISTLLCSEAVFYYSFGILASASVVLMSHIYLGLKNTKTLVKIMAATVVIHIVLMIFLSKIMEFRGLALAFSISTFFQMLLMFLDLTKKKLIGFTIVNNFIRKILCLTIFTTIFSISLNCILNKLRIANSHFYFLVIVSIIIIFYITLAGALKIEEVKVLTNLLYKFAKR